MFSGGWGMERELDVCYLVLDAIETLALPGGWSGDTLTI